MARFGRPLLLVAALLTIAVIALYAPVTGYDFINIDDSEYVLNNPQINHGLSWSGLKWAFGHPVCGNWHPVTMLSHMVDCQVYGLYPGGHHLTNVLLHLANSLLLFWVLLRMTRGETETSESGPPAGAPAVTANPLSHFWPCTLVAALFALHPLHVESVAWVSERKDLLSAFCFFLTLWAYAGYVRRVEGRGSGAEGQGSRVEGRGAETEHAPRSTLHASRFPLPASLWYLLALACFALGLMSKSMLVTLPFVLLLLDYWPLRRLQLRTKNSKPKTLLPLLLEKVPFFAMAAAVSVLTYQVQARAGAVVSFQSFPLRLRLANAVVSYARYLGKTFWPDSLAMPYPHHFWEAWQVQGAAVLFVGLSLAASFAARRRPYFFVGWFFFAGMLVPVIGLVQVGLQAMADHFTYLPLIGVFVALAWWFAHLPVLLSRRRWLAGGAAVLVAALGVVASAQLRCWRNSETLFAHAVHVTPNNAQARYLRGAVSDGQGNAEEAIAQFAAAVQANPAHVRARCGLAYVLCGQGRIQEAAQEYEAALRVDPDCAKAHFGLADILLKQHKPDEAMAHYVAALRSQPDIAAAHYQLAGLFSAKKDSAARLSHLQEAVQLAPDWAPALNDLAWMRATHPEAKCRNGPEAIRLAMRAVTLTRRGNPNTLDTLAAAYAEAGRFPEAVRAAQTAVQLAATAGQTNLVGEIQVRLKLYQAQQPYRE